MPGEEHSASPASHPGNSKMKKSNAIVPHNNGTSRKVYPSRVRTRIWRAAFLRTLAKTPNVSLACRSARISTRAAYNAREADPEFAEQWLAALNQSVDKVEAKVFEQAIDGNEQLAMFILKAHRPEIYRENVRHEVGLLGGLVILPEKKEGAE